MQFVKRAGVFLIVATLVVLASVAPVHAQPAGGGGDAPAPAAQSFFDIVWLGSGWLGVVIGAMSIVAVTFIIEHFWTTRRATIIPEDEPKMVRELIEKRQFKECVDAVSRSRTMFGDVLTMGLRHGRHGFDAMQEAVEERANAWRARLFRKIEYLNIIGNISPLLGLLGTVVGMIYAFGRMGQGGYGPDELAGGISIALVSTFLGLIVAIVSLLFFGICRNRADSLTVAAHASVVDILEYFRPAVITSQQSVAPAGRVAPGAATPGAQSRPAGMQPLPASAFPAPAPPGSVGPPSQASVELSNAFGQAAAQTNQGTSGGWSAGNGRDEGDPDSGPAMVQPAGPA